MTDTKVVGHTPGPWIVEFSGTGGYDAMTGAWAIRKDSVLIAEVDQSDYGQNHCDYEFHSPEAEANARLIAAAPELLEALMEIHKLSLCPTPNRIRDWSARVDVMADFARKAIAKAEGRTP